MAVRICPGTPCLGLYPIMNRFLRFCSSIYYKLVRINANPHKIAIGLGIGVFTGIIPGSGPIAALFLASLFRVNKASALLGSILTNTWLSVIVFLFSIKLGSYMLGLDWHGVNEEWTIFFNAFHWHKLFKISTYKIILPVITGYIIISFIMGILAYLITLFIHIRTTSSRRC